jgi:hypothetical protein
MLSLERVTVATAGLELTFQVKMSEMLNHVRAPALCFPDCMLSFVCPSDPSRQQRGVRRELIVKLRMMGNIKLVTDSSHGVRKALLCLSSNPVFSLHMLSFVFLRNLSRRRRGARRS